MGIFGKGGDKPASAGLGRGVSDMDGEVMEVDAGSRVIDQEPSAAPRSDATDAASVVAEVTAGKPSRAERKAAAADAKARARAEAAEAKASGAPLVKKSRKAQKAEKDAEAAALTNVRLSNQVMIDFYPGMAKEDAIETARHWAMTHMSMPSMCFYYVAKIRDGYAIEVQEGVGRAYLPSVLELAQANPGRLVIVPMVRRKMTIFFSSRLSEFEAQILPELQEPPSMPENPPIQAVRGPSMTPIMKQYREWLVAGGATAAIGGLALLSSLAFYAFDSKAKVPPEWRTTDVAQLPVLQWSRLQPGADDSYVTRFEFADGQWRVVRQAVDASVDVATPDATDSSGAIVGGQVPTVAPDGAGPAGAPGTGALPPPGPATAAPGGAPATIPPPANVPNS